MISGLSDDIRKSHPHLFYYKLELKTYTRTEDDTLARMMIRADEIECSLSLIKALLKTFAATQALCVRISN